MIDALPPHSIEAEEALIGAALSDPAVIEWSQTIDLTPTDFYRKDHQHIWRAMCALAEARKAVDIVTVGEYLMNEGVIEYPGSMLSDILKSGGHVWNATHYGSLVKQKALRRDLLQTAATISGLAYTESEDIHASLDKAEELLRQTRKKTPDVGRDPNPKDIIARMEGMKVVGTSTRWQALNVIANGGMTRGHLWVIGGFSSTGKSAVLANLLEDVVNANHGAMVASTEMTAEQYMLRLVSITSNIPQRSIRGVGLTLDQSAQYEKAKTFWESANIRVFDDLYTVPRIRRQAKRMKEQQGLDVVFVDFLQNLSPTGDEFKDARSSIIELQQMAKELDVCVVALSQVSNAMAQMQNETGVGNYYSFKGHGAIRDAADLAIMLDRDRVNSPDVMWMNVVKNRHGQLGRFACWFDLGTGLLRQMTDEEMAEKDPNSGRKSRRRKSEEEAA